jgi:very-short-patch-repair endonuclease
MTAIEIDGAAYHSTPDQIARDQERQNYLESLGWLVIRFTGSAVRCHSPHCVYIARDRIKWLDDYE